MGGCAARRTARRCLRAGLAVDTQRLSALSRLPCGRRGARRIQRQVHDQSDGFARFFAGNALDCFATASQNGHAITAADIAEGNEGVGLLAGDAVHARYTFAKGVLGSFSSVRGKGGTPSRFGLQIFGSKGIIEIGTGYPAPVWLLKDAGWSPGRSGAAWQPVTSNGVGQPETIKDGGLHAGNVAAVNDLLDAIENDRQPACGMYDGRAVVEMICAVFASQRAGKPVALPLTDRGNPLAGYKSA